MFAEVDRIKSLSAGSNTPLGVRRDFCFELRQSKEGVVVIDCGERVLTTERQKVPVVATNAFARENFFPTGIHTHAATALVAGPSGVNAFTPAGVEFAHDVTHGSADPTYLTSQKTNVTGPHEVMMA